MTKTDFINTAETLMKDFLSPQLPAEVSDILKVSEFSFFEAPIIGFAAADDPLFEQLKQPDIVGDHIITPSQWLKGARSVVSIFVPYSQAVKKANSSCPDSTVAPEYIYAKAYTQPFMDALAEKLCNIIKAQGYSAVVPSKEADRMKMDTTTPEGKKLYTSRWSERHIAYVCGLGTFGISGGLITSKGVAGRYISLVTDMPLEPDPRPYTQAYEYCTLCGACAVKCPAGAITVENKKDKEKCSAFVGSTKQPGSPHYGCAKCQCGVPCANGIPNRK